MSESIKRLVLALGFLSLVPGIFLALTRARFEAYASGIIFGIVLIASVFIYDKVYNSEEEEEDR